MSRPGGVLLDVDGTLVDSNDAHAHAWVEAFAEHGIETPFDRVRRCIGMGGDKLMPEVAGISEEESPGQEISQRRGEIFRQRYLPKLRPTPGAEALLQRLHEEGFKLVVASSAKQKELKELLEICGAHRYIEDATSSDDAENSKPDPDILQAALKQLGLPADRAVLLGDTPYDLEAAQRIGLPMIAVRCGGWAERDLRGAAAVYRDPADLLARFAESPLAG